MRARLRGAHRDAGDGLRPSPGADAGSFAGVAAQKLADRESSTTQIQAGWYRYTQTWTLFLDGTTEPGLRFTAWDRRLHGPHAATTCIGGSRSTWAMPPTTRGMTDTTPGF